MSRVKRVDRLFLGIVILLLVGGYFIFASASFGLLLDEEGAFTSTAFTQIASITLGVLFLWIASRIPLSFLRNFSWIFALIAVLLMILVLFPDLGVSHGGAQRWFIIGGVSFQPGEFFKLAFIMSLAAWLSFSRPDRRFGARPLLLFFSFLTVSGILFLLQPDTDSLAILLFASCLMYKIAGFPLKHIVIVGSVVLIGAILLFSFRPYLLSRLTVFLNPDNDPLGAGYQLQQSLIAIGSGGIDGKGFGKSVQKFNRLPEPTSDSIFAVFGEEFGFVGTIALLLIFSALILRGLRISARAPDSFSMFLSLGCIMLIGGAAFINFASMLGLIPLSGLTLPFISRGGSSMLATLIEVGLILNVSRHAKIEA